MDLSKDWPVLQRVSRARLAHNKTRFHIAKYGPEIELLGTAGEFAARRFLGLSTTLHDKFDGGVDLIWRGWTVDVKTTKLVKTLDRRSLQWPEGKPCKADLVLLVAVNTHTKRACAVGWIWARDVVLAPVNTERHQPCHELPIPTLMPLWRLYTLLRKEKVVGDGSNAF